MDAVEDGPEGDADEVDDPVASVVLVDGFSEVVVERGAVVVGSSSSGSEVVVHSGFAVLVVVDPGWVSELVEPQVVVDVGPVVVVLIGAVVEPNWMVSGKVDGGTGPGPVLTVEARVVGVAVVFVDDVVAPAVVVSVGDPPGSTVGPAGVVFAAVLVATDGVGPDLDEVVAEAVVTPFGTVSPSRKGSKLVRAGPLAWSSREDGVDSPDWPAGEVRSISLLACSAWYARGPARAAAESVESARASTNLGDRMVARAS